MPVKVWACQHRYSSPWTADRLLRQVSYQGLREDRPAKDVRNPA